MTIGINTLARCCRLTGHPITSWRCASSTTRAQRCISTVTLSRMPGAYRLLLWLMAGCTGGERQGSVATDRMHMRCGIWPEVNLPVERATGYRECIYLRDMLAN